MEQECLQPPEGKQNDETVDGTLVEFDNQTDDTDDGDNTTELNEDFLSELDNMTVQQNENIDREDGDFLKELENFDPE